MQMSADNVAHWRSSLSRQNLMRDPQRLWNHLNRDFVTTTAARSTICASLISDTMRISCWNWDAIGTKQRINFPDLLDPRIQEQLHFLQKLKLKLAGWDHLKVDGNGTCWQDHSRKDSCRKSDGLQESCPPADRKLLWRIRTNLKDYAWGRLTFI